MPRIDNTRSITDSLKSIGESMFKPIDPVSAEKLRGMQMQSAARTKMITALQNGDLVEAGAQGILGGVPIDDALGMKGKPGI
jgi:hypothetical protein